MNLDVSLDSSSEPRRAELRLRGEFASLAAATFSTKIDEVLDSGFQHIALEMRRVEYINSTALGALVRARQLAIDHGGQITIVNPSEFVLDMIRSVGLDAVLPIVTSDPSVDDTPKRAGVVVFSFADARASMLRVQRSQSAVGRVLDFDTESMTFGWDPSRHRLAPDELYTLFDPGSSIHLRFGVKLAQKDRFRLNATIDSWRPVDNSGEIVVRVLWSQLPDDERDAIERFQRDMDTLRESLDDPESATG